jgi:glycerol-3-phosphate dehydrogenase
VPSSSSANNILSTSWFSSSSEEKKKKRQVVRDPGLAVTSVVSYPKEVPAPKGLPTRTEQVNRLKQVGRRQGGEAFDILVVGGGATGAGIALDSAVRGLSTACIERGDFSSETSSRSTKLIWAGIKYMATATAMLLSPKLITNPITTVRDFVSEMKMVFHCHQERKFMMQQQEHLCSWIPIVIPFTSWHVSPPPFNHPLFGFFPVLAPPVLKFYDALSQFTCPPSYVMTPRKVRDKFPQLDDSILKYCAVFYEAQHNDARTNIAIALTAAEKGAAIANYVEMVDVITEDGDDDSSTKVIGVKATDRMTGETFEIRAKKVIFAGGPFTDKLRELEEDTDKEMKAAVSGAPGTHIVLPGYLCPKDVRCYCVSGLSTWSVDIFYHFFFRSH